MVRAAKNLSHKPISAELVIAKDEARRLCIMCQCDCGCVGHAWCAHSVLAMAQNSGNLLPWCISKVKCMLLNAA